MKAYRVTCLWERWKFLSTEVKAASPKAAKKKGRKHFKGRISGLYAVEISP
jgi:hypothetical protein